MTTHISHIRISNILGISNLEFDAGKFVEISGPNGSGKTSILEAIKATLRSGHDATLLRAGAESGEAVIVLDDGTEIVKRVKESGSDTIVKDATGKRQSKPASVVGALADLLSVNPVDFLRASKKDRVRVLLESMPITLDADRLTEIVGKDAVANSHLLRDHALVVLESLRKSIYDDRTGTNRAVKEKHATINQLAATLPDEATEIPGGANDLLERLQALDAAKDAELERISTKLGGLRDKTQADIDAVRSAAQSQIDELQRQIEAIRTKAADDIEAIKRSFSEIEGKANIQRQRTVEKHAADSQGLRDNLAAIQEAQKSAARHEATRKTIGEMRRQADGLQEEADAQTAALEGLEAYKSELLASLPIPGLTVVDGEIYRDGVQFDRLNQAQQVQVAVELAKLRAGKLGVICCDGLECLDTAAMQEFQKQALESGLQLFVSRVSDTEFTITNQE